MTGTGPFTHPRGAPAPERKRRWWRAGTMAAAAVLLASPAAAGRGDLPGCQGAWRGRLVDDSGRRGAIRVRGVYTSEGEVAFGTFACRGRGCPSGEPGTYYALLWAPHEERPSALLIFADDTRCTCEGEAGATGGISRGRYECLRGGESVATGKCRFVRKRSPRGVSRPCPRPRRPCRTNARCARARYCAKPPGRCDNVGECQPRPRAEQACGDEVCGCDRVTYASECEAAAAGMSLRDYGPCL